LAHTPQRRTPRRVVDGVLFLDKPLGLSSNNALQKARWLLKAAKGGHTGTLDPMATGLLPLTFGEATKFSQTLLDADKVYEATVLLGVTTTTADAEGEVLANAAVDATDADIEAALERLRGDIDQVPPMYSALKHHGKALYEYARVGIDIPREARRVTIHSLEFLAREGDSLKLRVACSKGTYVRTLASDLGALLGCGAHLTALRRTRIGPFELESSISLVDFEALPETDGTRSWRRWMPCWSIWRSWRLMQCRRRVLPMGRPCRCAAMQWAGCSGSTRGSVSSASEPWGRVG
jgi:tRNA pseudouridine55 synthase